MNFKDSSTLMTTVDDFYWYASPGPAIGVNEVFDFHSELPPNVICPPMDRAWTAAVVEMGIPSFGNVSAEDEIKIRYPGGNATVSFSRQLTDATSTIEMINDALQALGLTEISFTSTDNVISVTIADDCSVRFSNRLALIMGFYTTYLNETATASAVFDVDRSSETVRLMTNLFNAIGGDLYPSPTLFAKPHKGAILFVPQTRRYFKVDSSIYQMNFKCVDVSGQPISLPKSCNIPYILLHFTMIWQ